MADHLFLVGMMGAGKTTIGEALASRLGWGHLDSDAQVEAATGRTVPRIFAESGEAAFRAEEARALAEAAASPGSAVISVAGGAVLDPGNRAILGSGGRVVWLRARPETLARRVGSGAGRPLLEHDPAGTLRRLAEERRPFYEELAQLTVDVDDAPVDAVVDRIMDWLGRVPA